MTGDLKLLNEVYGLMKGSSKHLCLYCTAEAQQLAKGLPRTLGSLKNDYQRWKSNSGRDKKAARTITMLKTHNCFRTCLMKFPFLK